MTRTFKFIKEQSNRWYIELPEWQGSKDEIEMVAGADMMLEVMSEGNGYVWLLLSEEPFENADQLKFIRNAIEIQNGAFYNLETFKGIELNLEMWLCDVTKFVFGSFPNVIYVAVQSNE
jgi:hypothetical protein